MANDWRSLTSNEQIGNENHESDKFGTYSPNLAQKFLIQIGKISFLKRGVFRGSLTKLILSLSEGPLDIKFRGCSYRIWGKNNLIEYGLLLNPNYNHKDLNFLLNEAPSDANFIDIGSNIGLYSLPMAKTAPKGITLSIDANPLMASRLRFNADATRFTNIIIEPVAVSDSDGKASLIIRKNDIPIVTIEESKDGKIPIRTLKSLIEEHGITRIYGLKIDIEGHEDKALVPFLKNVSIDLLPKKIVIEHIENKDYQGCEAMFKKLNYKLVDRSNNNSFYELEQKSKN